LQLIAVYVGKQTSKPIETDAQLTTQNLYINKASKLDQTDLVFSFMIRVHLQVYACRITSLYVTCTSLVNTQTHTDSY